MLVHVKKNLYIYIYIHVYIYIYIYIYIYKAQFSTFCSTKSKEIELRATVSTKHQERSHRTYTGRTLHSSQSGSRCVHRKLRSLVLSYLFLNPLFARLGCEHTLVHELNDGASPGPEGLLIQSAVTVSKAEDLVCILDAYADIVAVLVPHGSVRGAAVVDQILGLQSICSQPRTMGAHISYVIIFRSCMLMCIKRKMCHTCCGPPFSVSSPVELPCWCGLQCPRALCIHPGLTASLLRHPLPLGLWSQQLGQEGKLPASALCSQPASALIFSQLASS